LPLKGGPKEQVINFITGVWRNEQIWFHRYTKEVLYGQHTIDPSYDAGEEIKANSRKWQKKVG
jgi:hypothetical protein